MIHIIGLGVSEKAELSTSATASLMTSSWVVGSERQLAVIEDLLPETINKKILPALKDLSVWLNDLLIEDPQCTENITILASGDPLYYGIGRWFTKHFSSENLRFYPAISSIQAACHELGLALQDVDVLSLHGRPLSQIRKTIKPSQNLLVLSDKNSQPQVLAQECIKAGFLNASITVLEKLGYTEQKISVFDVKELADTRQVFDSLHISVIKTGQAGVTFLPSFPGIADENFITDMVTNPTQSILTQTSSSSSNSLSNKAMISKREVRLAILSLMQANNADIIWDIGAGCGSVSIELTYWNKQLPVFAIEHNDQRLACLHENRERFGVVSQLEIIEGSAPEILVGLPAPTKVFIGGSDGRLGELLDFVWQTLPENGVLVASAVTETSKQHLIAFLQSHQNDCEYETLQIAVSKGSQLAGQLLYRPSLPVTLFKFTKAAQ